MISENTMMHKAMVEVGHLQNKPALEKLLTHLHRNVASCSPSFMETSRSWLCLWRLSPPSSLLKSSKPS
ncbi:rCG45351 [Rattus norvegicus]|uniref:RCG45351 n=1 Tax=Rattus norvegicus TaxID=10116 RepID=A6K9B2_RAT|nr:rCG45351 [Rattus norvegicus]